MLPDLSKFMKRTGSVRHPTTKSGEVPIQLNIIWHRNRGKEKRTDITNLCSMTRARRCHSVSFQSTINKHDLIIIINKFMKLVF